MKQNTGRKLLSFLIPLAMVIGLMQGMTLTAYAEWWDEDQIITDSKTINGSVPIYENITLTINPGVTLTINCNDENAGITAKDQTLTVTGGGKLVINGWDNNAVGNKGDDGGNAQSSDHTGGNGQQGGQGGQGGNGGNGGQGYVGAHGEEGTNGGDGGKSGTGGTGGAGIAGNVTVINGSIKITRGQGGQGG